MDDATTKPAANDDHNAPFRIGDRVTQRGCEHFGVLTVTDVEWIVRTAPGIAPYWLVTAAQEQAPQQDHPPGTCGIVVAGDSRAAADRFALAASAASATTTGEAPDNDRDATASIREAAMSKDCVRLARAVAFELRSVARYHQPVTKDEVRVRSAFMLKLADNLEWALNGIATTPATPAAVTEAQRENAVRAVRIQFGERSASPEEVVDMVIAAIAAAAPDATKATT